MDALNNDNPTIEKQTVITLSKACKSKKVKSLVEQIPPLFPKTGSNKSKMELYNNSGLEKVLKKLAEYLSGSITNGNKKVALAISGAFSH
jgi:hypothetical protein